MPSFAGKLDRGRMLINVLVSPPATAEQAKAKAPPEDVVSFRALLDTGATISGISEKVVSAMDLVPDGWRPVTGVHGTQDTPTCCIAMHIPISEVDPDGETIHMRGFAKMNVTVLEFQPDDFDVLIGMDLLQACHLSMSSGMFFLSV